MNLNDANALADQVTERQGGERGTAMLSGDLTAVGDLAVVAVEGTAVAVEVAADAAGGLLEVIGEILAGILS